MELTQQQIIDALDDLNDAQQRLRNMQKSATPGSGFSNETRDLIASGLTGIRQAQEHLYAKLGRIVHDNGVRIGEGAKS